ncbi:MAG: septum formation initiator family protein [Mariprofundus sp.]|nr:septum formation initiator family protein [Mariprofundus sp.]
MGRRIGYWLSLIASVGVLAYMSWNLFFSDHGYFVYRAESQQLQLLRDEVAKLEKQREQLSTEILRLRNDPDAMEELIHRELGYVYSDEFMIVVPKNRRPAGKK